MNNNNNNEYNIKLYNLVFNNRYIKRIIFNHLTIYNILYNNIQFKSYEQFKSFKYKEYLNNVILDYQYDFNQLPENIKHIEIVEINKDQVINNLKSISNHIESIRLNSNFSYFEIESKLSTVDPSVLSKIICFNMNLSSGKEKLNKALQSVTDLRVNGQSCNSSMLLELFKKEMLPSNLKRIRLDYIYSIEDGCSFKSLSFASLHYCSPLIVNQILSDNLIKLEFIGNKYNIYFKIDSSTIFPESLQELSIECYSFNAKLPSNLKSLKLIVKLFEDTIIFPSSLEQINVYTTSRKNKQVFNNRESVPPNLKSLEFPCSSIVDNNGESILPDKLEKLSFPACTTPFNQVLQVNQLPSSLTYLNLGEYDKIIDINVLPSNLKTLVLGNAYKQIINPLAIPQQLELLVIENIYYNYLINLPVSTHPNLLIDCKKLGACYNESNKSIRKLKLPYDFNSSLSTLQLQDKSSLEYLHLGYRFDQPIELSDLPINNNIKTLELSFYFNQTINLEYFQNLETIILPRSSRAKITTTIINQQQDIIYNNYNLKNIIVPPNNNDQIIINLDINFYQFIKYSV